MLPYYLLVSIPLFLSTPEYLFAPSPRRARMLRAPVVLFFLGLFCLLSLRHTLIGVDTARYAWHFDAVSRLTWEELWGYREGEWAFFLLCKLVSSVGGDYRTLLFVAALACTLPVAVLYGRYTASPSVTLALYPVLPIFMMSFSGLRQAIAVALAAPVFCAAIKKQWGQVLLWVALAFCFHRSALILLLLIPAVHVRLKPRHLLGLIPLYVAVYAARRPLFTLCLRILGESDRYDEMTESGGTGMLLLFAGCLLLSLFLPAAGELDEATEGMRTLCAVAVLLQLFSSVHPLSMRMNYYFILFIPLLLGRILSVKGRLTPPLAGGLRAVLAAFFVIMYITRITVSDSLGIYPYRLFWL